MSKAKDRGAILQLEIDRTRWLAVHPKDIESKFSSETQIERLHYIARTAISDTIRNGGTFVLVASATTITMVQRPDAEDFDTPSPQVSSKDA